MFGVSIGRRYIQRLAILRAIDAFGELSGLRALRLHQLTGNRTGQYAITLTANYRLIIERLSDESISVVSVEDYHGN
jgi:proteic killer suppression protein